MHKIDIHTLRTEIREVHDNHPAWTLDNAFVHWFLRAFLVADDELAAKAVTGVSHDKGVDAVFIDEDASKVFVLEGKYHQGEKAPLENRPLQSLLFLSCDDRTREQPGKPAW